jgi:acyl carrier protein
MSTDEIKTAIFRTLGRIAPEADFEALDPDTEFRDQLDIDSFDFLTFVIGLNEALGVEIPETDYPRLSTLNSALAYLEDALAAASPAVH